MKEYLADNSIMTNGTSSTTFPLEPIAPFRLDLTVWALRRRHDNLIDRWNGEIYRRLLVIDGNPVEVAVEQIGPVKAPRLRVTVFGRCPAAVESKVTMILERLLGIQTDLKEFYCLAAADGNLNRMVTRFLGLKPPRYATVFEALVNGIACQQLSLTNGIRTLNRLATTCGVSLDGYNGYAFPQPSDIFNLGYSTLQELKLSRQKVRALMELSQHVIEGLFDPEELKGLDDDTAMSQLTQQWGIGRWTAEYTLLRGLGRLHVFPYDDVGARNNLAKWLRLRGPLDYDAAKRSLAKWNPFAGLIYFHPDGSRPSASSTWIVKSVCPHRPASGQKKVKMIFA